MTMLSSMRRAIASPALRAAASRAGMGRVVGSQSNNVTTRLMSTESKMDDMESGTKM